MLLRSFESFEKTENGYLIHGDAADVKLIFMTDAIIRVRVHFDKGTPMEEESYTLVTTAWPDRMDDLLKDERSRITFVLPGESRSYPKEEFFYFSAFPMEGRAEGVYEKGSFYELEDAVLTAGYPLGVSNEYAEGSDCITISTRQGALVVVETIAD